MVWILSNCKRCTNLVDTGVVYCVSVSPDGSLAASGGKDGGWDKLVMVWILSNCKRRTNLVGHTGVVFCVSVSPDGSLAESGGKDGTAMLWDVNDGKHLYSLDAGGPIR